MATIHAGGKTLEARSIKLGALRRGLAEKIDLGAKLFTQAHAGDLFAVLAESLTLDDKPVEVAWLEEHVDLIEGPKLLEAVLTASGLKQASGAPGEVAGP